MNYDSRQVDYDLNGTGVASGKQQCAFARKATKVDGTQIRHQSVPPSMTGQSHESLNMRGIKKTGSSRFQGLGLSSPDIQLIKSLNRKSKISNTVVTVVDARLAKKLRRKCESMIRQVSSVIGILLEVWLSLTYAFITGNYHFFGMLIELDQVIYYALETQRLQRKFLRLSTMSRKLHEKELRMNGLPQENVKQHDLARKKWPVYQDSRLRYPYKELQKDVYARAILHDQSKDLKEVYPCVYKMGQYYFLSSPTGTDGCTLLPVMLRLVTRAKTDASLINTQIKIISFLNYVYSCEEINAANNGVLKVLWNEACKQTVTYLKETMVPELFPEEGKYQQAMSVVDKMLVSPGPSGKEVAILFNQLDIIPSTKGVKGITYDPIVYVPVVKNNMGHCLVSISEFYESKYSLKQTAVIQDLMQRLPQADLDNVDLVEPLDLQFEGLLTFLMHITHCPSLAHGLVVCQILAVLLKRPFYDVFLKDLKDGGIKIFATKIGGEGEAIPLVTYRNILFLPVHVDQLLEIQNMPDIHPLFRVNGIVNQPIPNPMQKQRIIKNKAFSDLQQRPNKQKEITVQDSQPEEGEEIEEAMFQNFDILKTMTRYGEIVEYFRDRGYNLGGVSISGHPCEGEDTIMLQINSKTNLFTTCENESKRYKIDIFNEKAIIQATDTDEVIEIAVLNKNFIKRSYIQLFVWRGLRFVMLTANRDMDFYDQIKNLALEKLSQNPSPILDKNLIQDKIYNLTYLIQSSLNLDGFQSEIYLIVESVILAERQRHKREVQAKIEKDYQSESLLKDLFKLPDIKLVRQNDLALYAGLLLFIIAFILLINAKRWILLGWLCSFLQLALIRIYRHKFNPKRMRNVKLFETIVISDSLQVRVILKLLCWLDVMITSSTWVAYTWSCCEITMIVLYSANKAVLFNKFIESPWMFYLWYKLGLKPCEVSQSSIICYTAKVCLIMFCLRILYKSALALYVHYFCQLRIVTEQSDLKNYITVTEVTECKIPTQLSLDVVQSKIKFLNNLKLEDYTRAAWFKLDLTNYIKVLERIQRVISQSKCDIQLTNQYQLIQQKFYLQEFLDGQEELDVQMNGVQDWKNIRKIQQQHIEKPFSDELITGYVNSALIKLTINGIASTVAYVRSFYRQEENNIHKDGIVHQYCPGIFNKSLFPKVVEQNKLKSHLEALFSRQLTHSVTPDLEMWEKYEKYLKSIFIPQLIQLVRQELTEKSYSIQDYINTRSGRKKLMYQKIHDDIDGFQKSTTNLQFVMKKNEILFCSNSKVKSRAIWNPCDLVKVYGGYLN